MALYVVKVYQKQNLPSSRLRFQLLGIMPITSNDVMPTVQVLTMGRPHSGSGCPLPLLSQAHLISMAPGTTEVVGGSSTVQDQLLATAAC